jgi:hypothetical protein
VEPALAGHAAHVPLKWKKLAWQVQLAKEDDPVAAMVPELVGHATQHAELFWLATLRSM